MGWVMRLFYVHRFILTQIIVFKNHTFNYLSYIIIILPSCDRLKQLTSYKTDLILGSKCLSSKFKDLVLFLYQEYFLVINITLLLEPFAVGFFCKLSIFEKFPLFTREFRIALLCIATGWLVVFSLGTCKCIREATPRNSWIQRGC